MFLITVRAAAGDVRVFEGHAFIVEAAVSLGGRELRPNINVYHVPNKPTCCTCFCAAVLF